jgi:RNA polymerase sigma-70 factor (ECF subfamily)
MALEDLRSAVELLPEAQRDVIILRFASGLSVADTAKALGKSENNVKVLQHKGMQRLQVLMTPKYPELAHRNGNGAGQAGRRA